MSATDFAFASASQKNNRNKKTATTHNTKSSTQCKVKRCVYDVWHTNKQSSHTAGILCNKNTVTVYIIVETHTLA